MVAGVLLLNLYSAQLSGDINENRAFWTALGLAWMVVRNPRLLAGAGEPGPQADVKPHRR